MSAPSGSTQWIAFVLRWGALLSAALLLAGVALALTESDVVLQIVPPIPLRELAEQLGALNPYAVMQAGVLLLLLTPLARILTAAVTFWLAGERRYAWVSLAVLAIILGSLLLARGN